MSPRKPSPHPPGSRRRAARSLRETSGVPWWRPTPKWWTLLATAATAVAAEWLRSGAFDAVERGMAATALAGLVASWAKSNEGKGG